MKTVYVLGNGQLGRMLRQAGEPLGIQVYPVGLASEQPEATEDCTVTAEIERWPESDLTRELAQRPQFINRDVFPQLADRLTQKQLLDKLKLATSPWHSLDKKSQWPAMFKSLGRDVIVKRRSGGYDGRGLWRIQSGQEATLPDDSETNCIVERVINFDREVSLIGARGHNGDCVFYPLTHNLHQQGMLRCSVAFPYTTSHLQREAERMLTSIMKHLNYVGVMAMECFVVGETLLINELAPRVHNSGHWTQNGASISQFELHLRAILQLPLPKPVVTGTSLMINLIGIELNPQWLAQPLARLHWYDKVVQQARKVGHINLTHTDHQALSRAVQHLCHTFPKEYQSSLDWLKQKIV